MIMKERLLWEFDYKSTRGDKAMKKEAREKHVLSKEEQKSSANPKELKQDTMHDINKPITLEDLTTRQKLITK